jgi:hypothetical protein
LKFEECRQTFKSHIRIDKDEFEKYMHICKERNILHEKPELAADEGITSVRTRTSKQRV